MFSGWYLSLDFGNKHNVRAVRWTKKVMRTWVRMGEKDGAYCVVGVRMVGKNIVCFMAGVRMVCTVWQNDSKGVRLKLDFQLRPQKSGFPLSKYMMFSNTWHSVQHSQSQTYHLYTNQYIEIIVDKGSQQLMACSVRIKQKTSIFPAWMPWI